MNKGIIISFSLVWHHFYRAKVSECINEVASSFIEALPHRLKERHKINYAILDTVEGEYKRYIAVNQKQARDHAEALIHSQQVFPVLPRWPALIRLRSKARCIQMAQELVMCAEIEHSRSGLKRNIGASLQTSNGDETKPVFGVLPSG